MKFSRSILEEFIEFNRDYSIEEIADSITQSGFEVEDIENEANQYKNFIIAEIIASEKHPESKKLNLCKINTGKDVLDIVCGGINANQPGLKIVLALPGAIVPSSGLVIKKSMIAGKESNGMICCLEELKLSGSSLFQPEDGIAELPENAPIGMEFAKFINLNDVIFHICITPNRGDGASVLGIARDICAKGLGKLKTNLLTDFPAQKDKLQINIADSLLPLFKSVYFAKGEIDPASILPSNATFQKIWGTTKNPAVDIINHTMFMWGFPMHIYDYSKIEGVVTIRRSISNEFFSPIAGEDKLLPEGLIVVSDEKKILSLLGIMGDKRSAFTSGTTTTLLESAHLEPSEIIKACNRAGFRSESSYRFERGVDYKIGKQAFAHVLLELKTEKLSIFSYENLPSSQRIIFSIQDYTDIIGSSLPLERIKAVLFNLGFKLIREDNDILEIEPPSFRYDVLTKEDIAEEISRIEGYNTLNPIALPNHLPVINEDVLFDIKKVLSEEMNEIITYSFFKEDYFDMFESHGQKIILSNPISREFSTMRDSLLPNLLENVAINQRKGEKSAAIFEVGTVFDEINGRNKKINFAGVFCGVKNHGSFLGKEEKFTIWNAKNKMIEVLFKVYGIPESSLTFIPLTGSAFHPKQSFKVLIGKNVIGHLVSIHPSTLSNFEIKGPVLTFEIQTSALPPRKNKQRNYKEKSLLDVEREISIIVPKEILFESISSVIKKLKISALKEIIVKEIFEDKNRIGEGMKSILLKFTIKQDEKTLTKEEIDTDIIRCIIEQLASSCKAIIRDGESAR